MKNICAGYVTDFKLSKDVNSSSFVNAFRPQYKSCSFKVKIIPSVIPWHLEQNATHHDLLPFLLHCVWSFIIFHWHHRSLQHCDAAYVTLCRLQCYFVFFYLSYATAMCYCLFITLEIIKGKSFVNVSEVMTVLSKVLQQIGSVICCSVVFWLKTYYLFLLAMFLAKYWL